MVFLMDLHIAIFKDQTFLRHLGQTFAPKSRPEKGCQEDQVLSGFDQAETFPTASVPFPEL